MTSNERKIIKSLWGVKGRARIQHLADACNLSNDYVRLICRSLARAGYIEFAGSNKCHLLKKGRGQFESVSAIAEKSEPVIVTANVTLLTDEPADTLLASDRDDKDEEENQGDGSGNKEDDQQANNDAELDKALADSGPTHKKDAGEKTDEAELTPEPKAEDEKPAVAEAMVGKEKELTEEAKAENSEKVALKEESAKPSGGFGASFKKIVNWFAEKK